MSREVAAVSPVRPNSVGLSGTCVPPAVTVYPYDLITSDRSVVEFFRNWGVSEEICRYVSHISAWSNTRQYGKGS